VIAAVRGKILARGPDHVVVETGGVGYKVFVPRHPAGDDALLHTHQVVREDGQFLFGFETREELALFELIIGVSGVGPRAALAILSVARPADVAAAIAAAVEFVLEGLHLNRKLNKERGDNRATFRG